MSDQLCFLIGHLRILADVNTSGRRLEQPMAPIWNKLNLH